MKNFYLIIGGIFSIILFTNCKKEVCEECIKCISYGSEQTLINEVTECNTDTTFLNGFEEGFIDGANKKGREAICFELGIVCRKE